METNDLIQEIERLRDALDHIERTARAARNPTRRHDWIAARAKLALAGKDFNPLDLPQCPKISNASKEIEQLKARIAELEKAHRKALSDDYNTEDAYLRWLESDQ